MGCRRAFRWQITAVLGVALAVGCGGGSGAGSPSISPEPTQPPTVWRVGNETIHLDCQGRGSPTVLLLAGAGDPTTTWDKLPRSGIPTRTCAYDYPGVEDSTDSQGGLMTTRRAVSALESVLPVAGVKPPYVVVGHSIAGLEARLFVGEHQQDVKGVVLFDPTTVEFALSRQGSTLVQSGWAPQVSARQATTVTKWPDIPVYVLGHDPRVFKRQNANFGWTDAWETLWEHSETALAHLSQRGVHRIVQGAGHYVYADKPQIALDAIIRVLAEVNAGGS